MKDVARGVLIWWFATLVLGCVIALVFGFDLWPHVDAIGTTSAERSGSEVGGHLVYFVIAFAMGLPITIPATVAFLVIRDRRRFGPRPSPPTPPRASV